MGGCDCWHSVTVGNPAPYLRIWIKFSPKLNLCCPVWSGADHDASRNLLPSLFVGRVVPLFRNPEATDYNGLLNRNNHCMQKLIEWIGWSINYIIIPTNAATTHRTLFCKLKTFAMPLQGSKLPIYWNIRFKFSIKSFQRHCGDLVSEISSTF